MRHFAAHASVPFVLGACAEQGHVDDSGSEAPESSESAWAPGDPIPGWIDYACPVLATSASVESWTYPATYATAGYVACDPSALCPSGRGWALSGYVGTCDGDCSSEDGPEADWMQFGLGRWMLDSRPPLGTYVRDDRELLVAIHDVREEGLLLAENLSYAYHADGYDTWDGSACVAELRPDRVSGWLRLDDRPLSTEMPSSVTVSDDGEPDAYFVPFVVEFPPGATYEEPWEGELASDVFRGAYTLPYDEWWPWDDITDPEIRGAIYEMYKPVNVP